LGIGEATVGKRYLYLPIVAMYCVERCGLIRALEMLWPVLLWLIKLG
jgi:hypothetical protein